MSDPDAAGPTPQVTADGLVTLRADPALADMAGLADPHAGWFETAAGRALAATARAVDPVYAPYNIARFRWFGDILAAAGDWPQILILGAGYDTRPWWLPALVEGSARIFEVDVASTLAAKRAVLRDHGVDGRERPIAVAADLDHEDLPARLAAAGWRQGTRSLVVIEGVLYYLRAATVARLLDAGHLGLGPDSRLAFDVWTDNRTAGLNRALRARGLPALFHPFPLPTEPRPLATALAARGFGGAEVIPLDAVARAVWRAHPTWQPDPGWLLCDAVLSKPS